MAGLRRILLLFIAALLIVSGLLLWIRKESIPQTLAAAETAQVSGTPSSFS